MTYDEYKWLKDRVKKYEDGQSLGGRAVKYIDDDVQWAEGEVVNEFPDYYKNYKRVDSVWEFFKLFKWILNLIFVGIPFSFVAQLFFFYNLYFNYAWNQLWANGNLFLLLNTGFCFVQTVHSSLLVAEAPFFM